MKYILAAAFIGVLLFLFFKKGSPDLQISDSTFLVDVRNPDEFKQGSVPNAVNIPLGTLESNLDQFKGKDAIVVFCRSGMRSGKAKGILEKSGIQNVTNGGSWNNVLNAVNKK